MSDANKADPGELAAALRTMFADGRINEQTLNKGLVCLAHEWTLRDDKDQALRLLGQVPISWVETEMSAHMADDPEFHEATVALATYLDASVPQSDDQHLALLRMRAGQSFSN
jgi:hypothetical protein